MDTEERSAKAKQRRHGKKKQCGHIKQKPRKRKCGPRSADALDGHTDASRNSGNTSLRGNCTSRNGGCKITNGGNTGQRCGVSSESGVRTSGHGELNTDNEKDDCRRLFPDHTIWLVHVITLIVRLSVVCCARSWWILHPDEVFQSLEVAHSEVYGYGFRPYEFLPPPDLSSNSSVAERQEAALGMYALRPFLFPRVFMAAFHVKEFLGITATPFVVGKVLHTFVAAHLPVSVYFFTISLPSSSKDMAVLAAILVSSSLHLNVLGTHTLINSFLAPWLFFLMAILLRCICNSGRDCSSKGDRTSESPSGDSFNKICLPKQIPGSGPYEKTKNSNSGICKVCKYVHMPNGTADTNCGRRFPPNTEDKNINQCDTRVKTFSQNCDTPHPSVGDCPCNVHPTNIDTNEGVVHLLERNGSNVTVIERGRRIDAPVIINNNHDSGVHGHLKLSNNCKPHSHASLSNGINVTNHTWLSSRKPSSSNTDCPPNGVLPNGCNNNGTSLRKDQMVQAIYGSVVTATTVCSSHNCLNKAKARDNICTQNGTSHIGNGALVHKNKTNRDSEIAVFPGFLASFGLGVICYMRVDILLTSSLVMVCMVPHWKQNVCQKYMLFLQMLFGFSAGISLGGLEDLYSYGYCFMSPYQWFAFNVQGDMASRIFGWRPGAYYIHKIFMGSTLEKPLLILLFLCLLYCAMYGGEIKHWVSQKKYLLLRLIAGVVILLVFYSSQGHKEVRFVHNVIVMYLVTVACVVISAIEIFLLKTNSVRTWYWVKLSMYIMLFINCTSTWWFFPSPVNASNGKWSYKNTWDSNHINECLHFIGQQADARGVFMDRSLHTTASYSILHKDIPIFTLVHYEFNEFNKASRKSFPTKDFLTSTKMNVSISILSRISNFITVENTPLLLKYLIMQTEYNYLVIKNSRTLIQTGFSEVYRTGTMRVMKRSDAARDNSELQAIGDIIPLGSNATVLEYEGSWLSTYGLLDLACQRLEAAIDLDPSRIRAYQLLAFAYQDLGLMSRARHVTQQCFEMNSRDRCLEVHPKVVLHSDLDLQVAL